MPLASPSSLTSNTLATFLDHVPISTNNAEKWKPKQMGSNSGGDYRALSRALSAPLGTERWISHHLFLSTETEAWGEQKQLQQYVYMSQKCLWRGSNGHLLLDMRGMYIMKFMWTFLWIMPHWYFHLLQDSVSLILPLWAVSCLYLVLHHLWYFSKIVSYCGINKEWINRCFYIYVGPLACKQCLIQWQQCFCAADWHNKATHCCEDMLGCLAATPLSGQNRSIVCHLIMHKPSRLKEYVSDAG